MRNALTVALVVVVALAGALGILLFVQSRDDASLERPTTSTLTAPVRTAP